MYHTKKYVLYDTYYTISYVQMKHCLRGTAPIGLLCDKDLICTIKRYWKRSGECLVLLRLMNSYMTWICIIYEFVQNKQGTADDGHYSEDFMVAENNMILDTTQKPKKKSVWTPDTSNQDLSWFKDTFSFLSPASQNFHNGIEKAKICQILSTIQGHWRRCKKHIWIHQSHSKSWFSLWESSCS